MRVIEYAPPHVRRAVSPAVTAYWTGEGDTRPTPVSVNHFAGGLLVACLGDGEEMDAAPGVVLLVEETATLENGQDWTRHVTRAANDYASDGDAPVLRTERDFWGGHEGSELISTRTTHDGRLPHYWRDELIAALVSNRIVIGDHCEELETEIDSRAFGDFSRLLWHAWKFLTTAKLSLSASYDPDTWRL